MTSGQRPVVLHYTREGGQTSSGQRPVVLHLTHEGGQMTSGQRPVVLHLTREGGQMSSGQRKHQKPSSATHRATHLRMAASSN